MRLIIVLTLFACWARASDYPPPLHLGPTNSYGAGVQRSMRLLEDSAATRKRTVRVLFYGQSVTQEIWSRWVGDFLRQRYPNANLVVTNLAVGYESELLSQAALFDIPSFYPDLMILQDYGPLADFEKIVSIARRTTTADLVIQTDHINHPEDLQEPTDPNSTLPDRAWRNYVGLPGVAAKYGAELADVRTYWKSYLTDYGLRTEDLLRDHIHPNLYGSYLMSQLVESHLRVDRSFSFDAWNSCEQIFTIGDDVDWTNNILQLSFTGNRVDVIAEASGGAPVAVRIDGKRPSEFPELYHFTRPDWYPNTYWISILKILPQRPLLEENWTARILTFSTNNGVPFATFEVRGSVTGPDGSGKITEPFISRSGRVTIDPSAWLMLYWAAGYYPVVPPLTPGYEIHWASRFEGKDEFIATLDDPQIEGAITLAQGLANGPHTLTLTRTGSTPLRKIRVYNPLARVQPAPLHRVQLLISNSGGRVQLQVPPVGRYVLESSSDCLSWITTSAPVSDTLLSFKPETNQSFYRVRPID